jgi:chorismate synthase
MASNSFGQLLRITTWGESHGPAIGVVIDGCPAGISLSAEDLQPALQKRAPGRNKLISPRNEEDLAHIYSGVFEGKTTGAPISIIIYNKDADSSKYEPIKAIYRPGHAQFTYLEKYGIYDYRGGGRASARETACRVAAGVVAKKILMQTPIQVFSYLTEVGDISSDTLDKDYLVKSLLHCPHIDFELKVKQLLQKHMDAGNSVGGIVGFEILGLPVGLGDPVYEKIEANLAKAMLSIPASKGFEIGEGFASCRYSGETYNDLFINTGKQIECASNHAGGTLGGITSGMPIYGRVAFKPTSSIKTAQSSVAVDGNDAVFQIPEGSRHDPCVAIRAVAVVEAMCYLVCADALLMNRLVKWK